MADIIHKNLAGLDAAHPPWITGATDPGAIGADKAWLDTSTAAPYQLKRRNATNTAWENVGSISSSFNDAEGDPANLGTTTSDGTSGYPARRDHVHRGFNDAEGDPADVAAAAADGTSAYTAHRDHAHRLGVGTTRGDLIRFGASGVPERLALGTAGTVLTSNGLDAAWATAAGGSGSGGGGGSGAVSPIQVIGPLSAAQTSLLFDGIPQTGYRHLRLVLVGRGTTAATSVVVRLQFNGDTSSAYDTSRMFASTSVGSNTTGVTTVAEFGDIAAASAPATAADTTILDIPNYRDATFQKMGTAIGTTTRSDTPGGNAFTNTHRIRWRNSSPIVSIAVTCATGNFDVGTYACLYGVMDTTGVLLTPASNLLYETTLTAATAVIDTGTLSQSYRDLQVEISGLRGDTAATETTLRMRFNGDSTAGNYDTSAVRNSNTTVTGVEQNGGAQLDLGLVTANNAASGAVSAASINIPGYTGATYWKTTNGMVADSLGAGAGNRRVIAVTGFWHSLSTIQSIQLTLAAGNFMAGLAVRVYGLPVSAGAVSAGTGTALNIGANQSIPDNTITTVAWDQELADADSQHYTQNAALTGTVAKGAGNATLTGTSTAFTTELSVGQVITVPGTAVEKRVVTGIASNTSLTVNRPFLNAASGQTATRVNSAIVFRQPGFYEVVAELNWQSNATGIRSALIVLNDTEPGLGDIIAEEITPGSTTGVAATTPQTVQRSYPFQMWDFVEIRALQNSGGALNIQAGARTHFSVTARPTVTIAVPYINIQDQRASGTAAGTFTSGAWQTRPLQTIVNDANGIASVVSNQITLPPGTYRTEFTAVAHQVDRHQVRLQNITDATTLALGLNTFAGVTATQENHSTGSGRFTLNGIRVIELQHRCQTTRSTDGFGTSASWGTEVYATVEFWKEG
jgi:hypothetical protein